MSIYRMTSVSGRETSGGVNERKLGKSEVYKVVGSS